MDGSDLAIWAKENATGSNAWLAQYYSSQITSTVQSMTSTFTFGGTTLLILVGVVLETFRELEAQLTMRNYKGFL
jgi:preprotein translocase subunit SecY